MLRRGGGVGVMLPFDTYKQSGFSFDDPSPQWYTLSERVGRHFVKRTCAIEGERWGCDVAI